jgi:hypothetical protein
MSKPTIIQVIKSVLAAAIGVQSDESSQRDFKPEHLSMYIIGGLVFTVLFISVLVYVVSMILGK